MAANLPFNDDFQRLYEGAANTPHARRQCEGEIEALQRKFASAARAAAEKLVAERALPVEQRTLRPLQGWGHAGGEKFIVGQLLLKFARDDKGLYGGDERAHKTANLELQAMSALRHAPGLDSLHTTLTALRGGDGAGAHQGQRDAAAGVGQRGQVAAQRGPRAVAADAARGGVLQP
jgi:hypothetical protein